MDFMLTFRGFVPGNRGRPADLHNIRELAHPQLKNLPRYDKRMELAQQEDRLLDGRARGPNYMGNWTWFKWELGGYEYIPLVQRHQEIGCQLDIVWIRPLPAGAPSGSDLDNCFKNLSDGLTMPTPEQAAKVSPPSDPNDRRRYCLLEDDSLVTGFSVKAFRSLEDIEDVSHVRNTPTREKPLAQIDLLIHVTLQPRWAMWGPGGVL
jgi:hypothetical protein